MFLCILSSVQIFFFLMNYSIAENLPEAKSVYDDLQSVKIEKIEKKEMSFTRNVYGTIYSNARISLQSEALGRITDIFVTEGDIVFKGDSIAKIDEGVLQAQLLQTEAILQSRKSFHDNNEKLLGKNLISENEYNQSLANLKTAEFNYKQVERMLEDTNVIAPMDGVITKVHMRSGDMVNKNKARILDMMDDKNYHVVSHISSDLVGKIDSSQNIKISIGSDGQDDRNIDNIIEDGKLQAISKTAEYNTVTFEARINIPNHPNLRDGLNSTVTLPLIAVDIYKVPSQSLVLNEDGGIGIFILPNIDEESYVQKAKFMPAKIERHEQEYYYISIDEKYDTLNVITEGQNLISDGEFVILK